MQDEELYQKLLDDLPRDGWILDAGQRFRRHITNRCQGHSHVVTQCPISSLRNRPIEFYDAVGSTYGLSYFDRSVILEAADNVNRDAPDVVRVRIDLMNILKPISENAAPTIAESRPYGVSIGSRDPLRVTLPTLGDTIDKGALCAPSVWHHF
jgi:hypothetical protein